MYEKIFLEKKTYRIVAYTFTLLLAPFAPKSVNYSSHSESLKYVWKSTIAAIEGKCRRIRNSSECLKNLCNSDKFEVSCLNSKKWPIMKIQKILNSQDQK